MPTSGNPPFRFNDHTALEGMHALLSPSSNAWLRYTPEQLQRHYESRSAANRGDRLHKLAHMLITERVRLPNDTKTLSLYVNDAITFRMASERSLFYSPNCYGTADTIKFHEEDRILRVHDLKTGTGKVSFDQLLIYCALFCLEYNIHPYEPCPKRKHLRIEQFIAAIYQGNRRDERVFSPYDVFEAMDTIVQSDRMVNDLHRKERR